MNSGAGGWREGWEGVELRKARTGSGVVPVVRALFFKTMMNSHFFRSALLGLTAMAMAAVGGWAAGVNEADPEVEREVAGFFGPGARAAFVAEHGMVTSVSAHATLAGLEVLRAGGNAFDAAVVVQLVLTVTEPYASGIGGGLLAMGYEAETGRVFALDGREEAPEEFSEERFRDERGRVVRFRERITGGNAVGVPGTVAACAWLLREHGTWTWEQAVAPAARIAREGFRVSEMFAANAAGHWDRLSQFPEAARLFGRGDGTPVRAGDLHRNPDLADTLERLGKEGEAWFYEGELAEEMVAAVRGDTVRPGVLSREDLANYRPVRREPVVVDYRGHQVYGMNMPSSGGVALGLMLNVLAETDFARLAPGGVDAIHRLLDVQNLGFADRNRYLADSDFVDVPVAGLLDPAYARERAQLLRADAALATPVAPGVPKGAGHAEVAGRVAEESPSTTHYGVVDRWRNVVSLTTTIEQHFGSCLVVPGRGFLLNNQLTDFDVLPAGREGEINVNAPEGRRVVRRSAVGEADGGGEGGKRPRSSMSPTIVLKDGKPVLAVGSPGGSRIIGSTLGVLVNVLDHGMDVQAAVNAPRAIGRNGAAELEGPWFGRTALRTELERRGFRVVNAQAVGSVQAIFIDEENRLHGAADPRREGLALGY